MRRRVRRAALLVVSLFVVASMGSVTTAAADPVLAPNDRLVSGAVLPSGGQLWALGNSMVLTMQGDGNLVVSWQGQYQWSTETGGNPGATAVMRADGNLVVNRNGQVLWQSGTAGWTGAQAIVRFNGHLMVEMPGSLGGFPIWWRDKGRSAAACKGLQPDPRGTTVTRWTPIVLCVLSALGQSPAHVTDILTMIRHESGGRPDAINLWDSNAVKGTPSKGLMQVIQPTFDRWRAPELAPELFDPISNVYAGIRYALNRYGSIFNIPGLVSLRNGGPYKGY